MCLDFNFKELKLFEFCKQTESDIFKIYKYL